MTHNSSFSSRKAAGGDRAADQNTQSIDYQISPILQADNALSEAINLAERAIPVFPCLGNKRPTCEGGFKAATTDIRALKRMWNDSAVLVGVPSGSRSGFDVLDVDPRHGGNDWLNANRDLLPVTRIHQTKSGGVHLLFKHHNGLRNSAGKIAPGVDVRADGGYVIWWPAAGLPILNDSPANDWSEWIIEALKPSAHALFVGNHIPPINADAYATAALKSATLHIANAPEGQRNSTLNKETWSILRFVASGQLSLDDAINSLAAAALSSGLARPEIMATLLSALSARGIS